MEHSDSDEFHFEAPMPPQTPSPGARLTDLEAFQEIYTRIEHPAMEQRVGTVEERMPPLSSEVTMLKRKCSELERHVETLIRNVTTLTEARDASDRKVATLTDAFNSHVQTNEALQKQLNTLTEANEWLHRKLEAVTTIGHLPPEADGQAPTDQGLRSATTMGAGHLRTELLEGGNLAEDDVQEEMIG